MPSRPGVVVAILAALGVLAAARPVHALLPLANASGEALFLRECAPCHGPAGHGDGPAEGTFRNTPRDFGDLARTEASPRIVERVRRSRLRMLEIDEEAAVERRNRIVDDVVAYLQRMPDVSWAQVHRGADVYAERCEKCHGPNGRPVATGALQGAAQPGARPPVPDFQKAHGDAELIAIAQGQGHPAMPGFAPVLSEDDARALVAYLRNLSDGFVAYSLWCAACHGDEGRGDGPLATGIDKPAVVFSHVYLGAQSPEELRRKAMHLFTDVEPTAPHFQRTLSEGQARAVLAAVRVLQGGDGAGASATGAARAPAATPHGAAPNAASSASVPAQMPAAVATMAAPAVAPVTPAAPGAMVSVAVTPSAVGSAVGATVAPAATPAPTVSRTPAPSRTPVVKAAKPKPAAAKTPAKKAVKPKATPKPAKQAKPKPKATPAKKVPAPRPAATPELELAP